MTPPSGPAATLSLRPATARDLDVVTDLHVTVWRETYARLATPTALARLDHAHRRKSWAEALADPARGTLLAFDGPALAGLVGYGPPGHPAFGAAGEIKHLYVAASHRRTGLGRRLLAAGRDALRDAGFPAAALAVVAGNENALAFYAASGGTISGRFTDPGPLWRSDNLVVRWDG